MAAAPDRTPLERVLAAWDRRMSPHSRMRHLPPRLAPHLAGIDTVLDCGTGDGEVVHRLSALLPRLSFVGVDVHLQPAPRIPVQRYDGRHLPFPDAAFDAVTMIDVLHHGDDPAGLIREALRVCRRRVIVKDHYWITRWDRVLLTAADYLGNRAYGVALPYNFLRLEQWDAAFRAAGARLTTVQTFRYSAWDRVKQVVFVAEPATDAGAVALSSGT